MESEHPDTPAERGLLRLGALRDHLGSHQVSRVIYGETIGLGLIVALQAHPPSAAVMIASLLGTAVAVALAEIYAELVGIETRARRWPTAKEFRLELEHAAAVAFGIGFPAIFFLLAVVGAIEIDTAFDISKWSGVGLMTGYGFVGARLARRSVGVALLHAAAIGAVGGFLILLKAIVH